MEHTVFPGLISKAKFVRWLHVQMVSKSVEDTFTQPDVDQAPLGVFLFVKNVINEYRLIL